MHEEEHNNDRKRPTRPFIHWSKSYPVEYHALLFHYGVDDRCDPVLIARNRHLIRIYEANQHLPQAALNECLREVAAAWEPVCAQIDQTAQVRWEELHAAFSWEAPWLPAPRDTDNRIFRDEDMAVGWLAEHTGIKFSRRLFTRMRDEGMGPYLVGAPMADLPAMCRWASFAFDLPAEGAPRLEDRVFEPLRPPRDEAPDWLLAASDSEETDHLNGMLEGIGANVVRVRSPLEAAQAVTAVQFHGMVMRFNHRIEAEYAIAYICMEESVPFVAITNGPERPTSMGCGGVVLHNPRSPYEIVAALERLPAARLVGLELPCDGPAAQRDD
ncbi:hypothetical protein [Methylobacterium nigriterrae]|uniref:hypothetical protein n=1 Tax=Methylobacterium nigriterrae TaxID=3127512 RepID=UPI003013DACB